jgi:hypothetical protein
MARPVKKDGRVGLQVEVPRDLLQEAAQLSWADVVAMASSAGWRTKTTEDHLWCAKDHALLREGYDEMRGIPVLLFQNW